MSDVLLWWVLVQIVGVIALPLTFLLFRNLSDRGFPFSKPLGILILSYALWILGTFRVLPNSRGSIIVLLFLFLFAALFIFSRCRDDLVKFVREKKGLILVEEGLFLAVLLFWAYVRSYNPDIRATEQPMDFGFMNAIFRSEYFPPNDPWLAGHSISYYYFGYLMMATLAKLSGLATSVAYNLSLAMLFGLVAAGAFSIAYNLVAARSASETGSSDAAAGPGPRRNAKAVKPSDGLLSGLQKAPIAVGLLAALFVVGIGNLEGALEMLRAHNIGSVDFWRWIGIKDALQPYTSAQWYPTENWWWWRATRVINSLVLNVDASGAVTSVNDQADYTITEFPFFSFLLGDMHPHVMALPFTLLAVAVSLNVLGHGKELSLGWLRSEAWRVVLISLILGSLGFLNSWDFPTQAGLFMVSATVAMLNARRAFDRTFVKDVSALAVAVGVGGLLLYLPFYVGFQSQASGVLPVLGPGTQLIHFAIFWGLFLVIMAGFLISLATGQLREAGKGRRLPGWPVLVAAAPVAGWVVVAYAASASGFLKEAPFGSFLVERTWRIIPMFVALAAALWALVGWLRVRSGEAAGKQVEPRGGDVGVTFALIMAVVGFALVIGPELFFIRDVFGKRMNTIFKFYYQAWVLLALAASYGLYYVNLRLLRKGQWRPLGYAWLAVVAAILAGSLAYPLAAIASKTNNFTGTPTLDGTAYVKRENPGEHEAIQWLIANAPTGAVIAEATGGQYSEYARVATRSGLPNILGWAGHEWQWRGSDKAYVGRSEDIDTIYRSMDREQVLALLQKYGVTYVYAGHLERSKYGQAALDRFATYMDTAFKNDTTAIYKVRR